MELVLAALAYGFVGVVLAPARYGRRHDAIGRFGVPGRGLGTDWPMAIAICYLWPAPWLLPAIRHPQPCDHPRRLRLCVRALTEGDRVRGNPDGR